MIITFYSFKGGVGRSMALANIANWLRLQNLRVAVIDWDLEAPGLECFFLRSPDRRAEVHAAPGLIDLLASYKERFAKLPPEFYASAQSGDRASLSQPDLSIRVEVLSRVLPALDTLMLPITPERQLAGSGGSAIYFLTPGVRDHEHKYAYARDVQSFDWGELYSKYDGEAFFAWLRSELEGGFDITLIDSRTGITEVGGVCTREMADVVVALCAPNDQNLEGCDLVLRSLFREELVKRRGERKLKGCLIPTRYDNGESDLLLTFQKKFESASRELNLLETDQEWRGLDPEFTWQLRLPYTPKYAYKERLCVGADDANPDLLACYLRVAQFIGSTYLKTVDAKTRARLMAASDGLRAISDETAPTETLTATLERSFAKLSEDARGGARVIFLRFVEVEDDQPRVTLQPRLASEFPIRLQPLLEELRRTHLLQDAKLASDIAAYRIPYRNAEQEWGRLREWIAADAAFLRFRHRLQATRALSLREGKSREFLFNAKALVAESDNNKQYQEELNEQELEFLRSLEDAPAQRFFALGALMVIAAVAVVGLIVGAWATDDPEIAGNDFPSTRSSNIVQPTMSLTSAQAIAASKLLSKANGLKTFGDLEGAKLAYSDAIIADPKDALIGRATILQAQGRWDLAEQDLAKAASLDPKDPALFIQLGLVRSEQGKLGASITDFQRSIQILQDDPTSDPQSSAPAYYELGQALHGLGKYEEAVAAYSTAIERRNDFWQARFGRALTYLQLNKKALAIDDLSAVAEHATEPSVRDNATAQLEALGVARTTMPALAPNERRIVYVQYADRKDKDDVEKLAGMLRSHHRDMRPPQRTSAPTAGDVRSFFSSDRAAALSLKLDAEAALLELGYGTMKLSVLKLDAKAFPSAKSGVIELWLPNLQPNESP